MNSKTVPFRIPFITLLFHRNRFHRFYGFYVILLLALLGSCGQPSGSPDWSDARLHLKAMPALSIRALLAKSDSSIYFAANDGQLGRSEDLGESWHIDTIPSEDLAPSFRAIASSQQNIFALSIASPALLYKINEHPARLVYRENHPQAFYDSMAFFDDQNGIAMGDPTNGCLSIILTRDGGSSWEKLPCEALPESIAGEAAFAASNTNIAVAGKHAWIATGGAAARVWHSSDMGKSWEVFDTPIQAGGKMTGIYSIAFWDDSQGIIIGGNWDDKEDNTRNIALTRDAGKTWKLVAEGKEPGFKSCVQYVPGTEGRELIAVGTTGISYSRDGGENWKQIQEEGFYTLQFIGPKLAVLAGENKFGRLELP